MLVLAGLMAGAIAAVIASVVSLPLNSPLDSVFNSATVTVAAIAVGLLAGLLWMWLAAKILWYGITLAALLGVVVAVVSLGDRLPGLEELLDLDRLASFSIPLAVIIIGGCAILTPLLASMLLKPVFALLKWAPLIALAIALAVGFGLITQGDSEAIELALPERPAATLTALIRTPAPTVVAFIATAVPTVVAAVGAATEDPTAVATPSAPPTSPATVAPSAPTAAPTPTPPAAAAETQTFLIGDGSVVTFTVEEALRSAPSVRFDAVITGAGLSGAAHLDGQPSIVNLDLHSLTSDQSNRDRYIRNRMFPDTPEAVFTVDQLPQLPPAFFNGEETAGELNGSLQIGETATPLHFQVTARHDGDVINILAQTTFRWDDLGLDKPSARSVVYLADEVEVQALLIARAP